MRERTLIAISAPAHIIEEKSASAAVVAAIAAFYRGQAERRAA